MARSALGAALVTSAGVALWSACGGGEGSGGVASFRGQVTSVHGASARATSVAPLLVRGFSLFRVANATAQTSTCPASHMLACAAVGANLSCAPVDPETCTFTVDLAVPENLQDQVKIFFIDDANRNGRADADEARADLDESLGRICNGSRIFIGAVDVDFTAHTATAQAPLFREFDDCVAVTPTPTTLPGASPMPSETPTASPPSLPGGPPSTPTPSTTPPTPTPTPTLATPTSTPTPFVTNFTFACNGTDALPGQTPVADVGSGTATITTSGSSYSGTAHSDGTSGGQPYSCEVDISNGQVNGGAFSDSFQATTPNCCSGTESGTCTTTADGTSCSYNYQGTFTFQGQTGQCIGTCSSQSVTPTPTPSVTPPPATPTDTPSSATPTDTPTPPSVTPTDTPTPTETPLSATPTPTSIDTATPTPTGPTPTATPASGDRISGFPIFDDPTDGNDNALGIATDATSMYVVGFANVGPGPTPVPTPGQTPGPSQTRDRAWRITKRNLADGALVLGFGDSGSGIITENTGPGRDSAARIVIDGSFMYVAGGEEVAPFDKSAFRWRIEKRQLSDGALVQGFGSGGIVTTNPNSPEVAPAIAMDASFLYIAGIEFVSPTDSQFRIEKRNLGDGALVTAFGTNGVATSNPTALLDGATAIALDTSSIYLIGIENGVIDNSSGDPVLTSSKIRFEKRSKLDGTPILAFGPGGATTIDPSAGGDFPLDLVTDGTFLYAYELDASPGNGNLAWRVEKRGATDGAFVTSATSSAVNPNDQFVGGLALDGTSLYLAGIDGPAFVPVPTPTPAPESNTQWRIEKRSLADLSLVPSFGTNGVVVDDVSPHRDSAVALAVQGGGVYVVGSDALTQNAGRGDEWHIDARFK